ncbi:hypothetical protein M378DRAFT_169896 [Amanita muscaria Koide BX008]|uniref:MINDY deubiquitinase domain-containing protein n=1 Tax=Amanita muscaria (strain Koide BX008) TaxID=946122 RepID=A0A0C2WQN7_AMAMK|nr:hypothetical protein M378DRAFT_169896 [Amanita muscaria Koide BX008]
MSTEAPTVQSSIAEVWYLKDIQFGTGEIKKQCKIITQNFNGPCSFIAICNILILRGDITIMPPDRKNVSYEFLSQLVAEYLLTSGPDVDVSAALSVLPYTQKGMDLNPVFTSPFRFNPSGEGKDLELFEHAHMKLVHGWLVDPNSPEAHALTEVQDYDSATILIAEADHLANGQLVVSEDPGMPQAGSSSAGPSGSSANGDAKWTNEQRNKVVDAIAIRQFLETTWSQLTYHGLFTLSSILEPGSLVPLFRSSHLSVLYKSTAEEDSNGPALYNLVTDQAFLNEPSVVWEKLDDIDLGSSTFVDSDFRKSSPAGGDVAGQTPQAAYVAALEAENVNDLVLAQQLQQEEDEMARRRREAYLKAKVRKDAAILAQQERGQKIKSKMSKGVKGLKKSDCVIM